MTHTLKIIALSAGILLGCGLVSEARAQEFCREYTANLSIGGRGQAGFGTACLRPDGSWQIIRVSNEDERYDFDGPIQFEVPSSTRIVYVRDERGPLYVLHRNGYYRHSHFIPPGHNKKEWKKRGRDRDCEHDHHGRGGHHWRR